MAALLCATLVLGLLGTGTELLLLEHTEDFWQLVPLALIAVAGVALMWYGIARSRASRAAFRGVMVLVAASGIAGTFLHYRGNAEFELEMTPGASGIPLLMESLAGATPTLAPGAMILLALIGIGLSMAWGTRRPVSSKPSGGR